MATAFSQWNSDAGEAAGMEHNCSPCNSKVMPFIVIYQARAQHSLFTVRQVGPESTDFRVLYYTDWTSYWKR